MEPERRPYLDLVISLPNIYIIFSQLRNVHQTKGVKGEKQSFLYFVLLCKIIYLRYQSHGSRYVFLIIYFIYEKSQSFKIWELVLCIIVLHKLKKP